MVSNPARLDLDDNISHQVASLVQELTTEVLTKQPGDLYDCCAHYLEKKLKSRDVMSSPDLMEALKEERHVAKVRQGQQPLTSGMTTGTGVLPAHHSSPVDVGRGLNALGALPPVTELSAPEDGEDCSLATLTGHKAALCQICLTPDFIISASRDGAIMVWDAKTGKKRRGLMCNKHINGFVFADKGSGEGFLVCGCAEGRFLVLCLSTADGNVSLRYGAEFSAHLPNPIRAMCTSPDLRWLATGDCFAMNQITMFGTRQEGIRGTVKIWDLENIMDTAAVVDDVDSDMGPVMLKTMKQLVSNSRYRQASYSRFVDWQDMDKSYGIRALTYTPDGSQLVVGFGRPDDVSEPHSRMLVVCCARTLATLWIDPNTTHQVNSVRFLPLVLGHHLKHWDLIISNQYGMCKMSVSQDAALPGTSGQESRQRATPIFHWSKTFKQVASSACFSPNGHLIALGLGSSLTLWDATSSEMVSQLHGHSKRICEVHFTADSKTLVSASEDRTIRVWRIPVRLSRRASVAKFQWRRESRNSFSSVMDQLNQSEG